MNKINITAKKNVGNITNMSHKTEEVKGNYAMALFTRTRAVQCTVCIFLDTLFTSELNEMTETRENFEYFSPELQISLEVTTHLLTKVFSIGQDI